MTETSHNFPSSPKSPLIVPALVTVGAIFVLDLTEAYDPAGSPIGWIIMAALLYAHIPLLRFAFSGVTKPQRLDLPRRFVAVVAVAIVALGTFMIVKSGFRNIFEKAVVPAESAQLGIIAQIATRMETDDLLYGYFYRQGTSQTLNAFPAGAVVPFALARKLGLDWRFASIASVILCSALLLGGLLRVIRLHHAGSKMTDGLLVPIALAASAWLVFPRSADYMNWGHTAVLWPLIALLGLALSTQKALIAALAAGLLASMSPGWLVMLPVIACFLFAEHRRNFPLLLSILCVFPAITYTLYLDQRNAFLPGVFGNLFAEGWHQEHGASWRFASIHAVTDWLHLRPVVYVVALAILVFLSTRIIRAQTGKQRAAFLLLAAFVVIACGPTTYFFHWISYSVLIAGLAPAFISQENDSAIIRNKWRLQEIAPAAAFAVLMFAAVGFQLRAGIDGSINHSANHSQGVDRNLLTGFNVRSEDHAWGKSPNMAVGFTMDRRVPGMLELRLGTLGGEFTPMNRTTIRVNGHDKGVFRVLPGDYRYARVPLAKEDVVIGFNVVELDAGWARTPRSLGIGADDRTLSISYLGMRFLPSRSEVQLAAHK